MTMTYGLRVDKDKGKPQVPIIDHPSLADAKRTFEEMKPTAGMRGTIVEYDGERAIRTVCVGYPRAAEKGGVLWESGEPG